ncbi:YdcF family protein [Ciceribacter sp. L1K23]|uniref:YdcF family protein n=1 Tax=Ciceribacter sp. L1K23 TaxID=2820276 RepID=UPI002011C0C1|nr:YdcF family protein [Ciceribacter sp. L1K23]
MHVIMTMGRTSKTDDSRSAGYHRLGDYFNGRRSPVRRALRYAGYVCLLMVAAGFGGFLYFVDSVTTLIPPENPRAEAIVVLTGGYQRIDQAVDLLKHGSGKRLLISGVNPSTTSTQIRRMTQSSAGLFECCVDMGYEAQDTIGNASETTRWIHDKGYRSVLLVTSNYHMPRSLYELRRINRDTDFIPYPVVNTDLKQANWYSDPDALRTLVYEYGKMVAAYARDITGWTIDGKGPASQP